METKPTATIFHVPLKTGVLRGTRWMVVEEKNHLVLAGIDIV
jgi:hypothetical protein